MNNLFDAAWVIARRDFVATVYSRAFILFMGVPLAVFAAILAITPMANQAQRAASQPLIALVADGDVVKALGDARARLSAATPEGTFPELRTVQPAENVSAQVRRLLADRQLGYSAVVSGTSQQPVLTGPTMEDDSVSERVQLIIDTARRDAALAQAGVTFQPLTFERIDADQAAGNLQIIRRSLARGVMGVIFGISILLATLMLSNLAEEKSNKVIEVLAAAVPLDAVFLGKLGAMLGISFVGLALWGGMLGLAYVFLQILQDWVTLPKAAPAVGWPLFALLSLVYYGTNFMVLGAFFLGIGAQASNIRDIQTLSMPMSLLQAAVFLLAITVVGSDGGALMWLAYILPFSSPLAMIAYAAEFDSLWPHLLALAWQLIWIVLIIRVSARMFRHTVLKTETSESFFDLFRRKA